MITETGRVVAIEADGLWVETIRSSTCNSCSVQKGCGHSMLNKVGDGKRHHMRVMLGALAASDFTVDDEVKVCIPEQVLVSAALLVYLLPLLSLLAGASLISIWWSGDVAALLGAVMGFALGLGLVRLHAWRNRNNQSLQPWIMPAAESLLSGDSLQSLEIADPV
ncbi:MAG: sigma-E factor negative regulatory protein RseC [Oceanicoccus sp.]|jgi:sigma-E factor negative regulatory protein RseC